MTGSSPGARDEPGIGGVDAADVGEDLAAVGAEPGGQRDGRRIGATTPERRDLVVPDGVGAEALEAGDDDDLALFQLLVDAARLDVRDARLAVAAVGGDARLWAGKADRRYAERVQRHRHERGALVFAGREEHVELAQVGLLGDGRGQSHELVGRVAHGRNRDDEVVAGRAFARDPPGDALDAVGTGQRRTAELLHDEGGCHIRRILAAGLRPPERAVGALAGVVSTQRM